VAAASGGERRRAAGGGGSRVAPARAACTPLLRPTPPQLTGAPELPLGIAVTVTALLAFGPLCGAFGGALFNPVHNAAFIAAGRGTVRFNAARMACQVAGASLGAFLAVNMLPEWLKE
jgi:hypothetical protein